MNKDLSWGVIWDIHRTFAYKRWAIPECNYVFQFKCHEHSVNAIKHNDRIITCITTFLYLQTGCSLLSLSLPVFLFPPPLSLSLLSIVPQGDMFTCQRKWKVNTMCAETKKTYYKENLSDIRSHAQFYNVANKLLHLPNYECAESLANKFADYFDEKIQRIRTTLQTPHSCAIDCTVCTHRPDTDCQLSSFVTVTRAEITQLLSKSPSKTCKLDPMPAHFVKTVSRRHDSTNYEHYQQVW